MKKVLVIDDWIEFLTVYGLSKKDGDYLIRDYGSPGNLLAEFKESIIEETAIYTIMLRTDVIKKLNIKFDKEGFSKKVFTVLILGEEK